MKKHDLKTFDGRKNALKEIEINFITALRFNDIELNYTDLKVIISRDFIEIGLVDLMHKDFMFASSVTLNRLETGIATINFGNSGSFTPFRKAPYWRTIHAAEFLKKWDIILEIINETFTAYDKLLNEIYLNESNRNS